MESIKPTKSKLAKTFQKVIHIKTATKSLSQNGFCLLIPQDKPKLDQKREATELRNRASMEAFVAKLFASVSSLKASYAELQIAQFPYNGEAIQSADEAMVSELKSISELKQSFLKKQIDSSPPHVTILLAEIQEQQSMMKMYHITMKKMQSEIESKKIEVSMLQKELNQTISNNKLLEKRLNSSGCFSVLDGIKLTDLKPKDFITALNYTMRSIRSFVKFIISEMESVGWDIDTAANSIQPEVVFLNANHRCFAFESFVCREMFGGFDDPNFSLPNESLPQRALFSEEFKRLKSVSPIRFFKQNPNSMFVKYTCSKYLCLVHRKMEESFSGNLNQRKLINSGEFPETGFFAAFAEMAKRVWLLHCLAFSFDQEVNIFQVRRNCRFSVVYMESVNDDVLLDTGDRAGGHFRVAFTVVPGFKIGTTVIQSQVYLSPARC